jgi:S1-C subfamily serine protease
VEKAGVDVRLTIELLLLIFLTAGAVASQSAPPRKDIPTIAKAANGAIVSIITSDKDGKPIAQGTGFLVRKDGRIVTNYHVIKGASSAIVKLPDGAFYEVDGVVAFDKGRDLAVIKAHGQNFRMVTLGNSDGVQVGEEIVAIGSPLSLESTVSSGIVSSIRTIEQEGGRFLQVTAPISPGSSGGPLFNMAGEVIGITTLYLKGGENLNFAIPINDAKRLLTSAFKVQDFPVGTVRAKSATDPETASPPTVSPATASTARGFYKQFYDEGKVDGVVPTFACFDDDPKHSQDFFTLNEDVYNERYAKAAHAHAENLKAASAHVEKDDTEAWQTMRSMEASEPDVFFIDDDSLTLMGVLYGTETREYLRSGGRVMLFGPYFNGIAPNTDLIYRWTGPGTGDSWVLDQTPSSPVVKTQKTLLRIDPTTRRYRITAILSFADGTSTYGDAGSGTCEKIPTRQSNKE